MSFEILKDEIKLGKIRNLYLFYGAEEYLKKFYTESIESSLLSNDLKELNRIVINGKADQGKIIEYCETLPVFSEKKIVIVKNSGLFKATKNTAENEKATGRRDNKKERPQDDSLLSFLGDMPDHVCLIFYETEIDKRLKLAEKIKEIGLVVEFTHLKPDEMIRWVIKRFKSLNKEVDSGTASMLLEFCETDMNEILNEIEKLNAFLGEKQKVTAGDIEKVCTKSVKSRVFDLTDALASKNSAKALKLLDDMIILKEPVQKIFYMITKHLRQLLQVKLLRDEGFNSDAITKKIGINPYAAGKLFRQTSGFTADSLKKAMKTALELDLAVKTGKINDRAAIELLIVELCQ